MTGCCQAALGRAAVQLRAWGVKNVPGCCCSPSCGRWPGFGRRGARGAQPGHAERCSTALQAGVINKQAHGKHIDFPELIAQQPVLSYQATLICNLRREAERGGGRLKYLPWDGRGGGQRAEGSAVLCWGRAGGQVGCLFPLAVLSTVQLLKPPDPRRRDRVFTQMLLIFSCNCLRYENIVSAARALHLLNLNSDA